MICPACGAKNREGARFCRVCGRPMDEGEHEDVAAHEQEAGAVGVDVPEAEAGPAQEAGGEEPGAQEPGPAVEQDPAAEAEPADESDTPPEPEPEATAAAAGPEVAEPEAVGPAAAEAEAAGTAAGDEGAEPAGEPDEVEPDEAELEIDEDELLGAFWREEEEPIEPAAAGTLIGDRYLVLEVLDAGTDHVLYLARDLERCWQCGAEVGTGEAFCPQCGAAQDQASQGGEAETRLLEVRKPGDEAHLEVDVAAEVTHEGRPFFVLARPEPEPELPPAPAAPVNIRLIVGQRSDPGQVRELDEDSMLTIQIAPTYQAVTSPVLGLFAVADGMGGHDGGEIASKLALQVLADQTLRTIVLPELAGELRLDEDVLAHLRKAVLSANDAVFLARQKRGNDMGTTLTAVLVRDRGLFVAHVGDSRAYRWSDVGLEQLTTDHSVVASMIAHGQIAPEEIYTHPHRSVVYRCVGDQPTVEVDGDLLPLEAGNRIVICSDGVWEMVRTEGIADVMMQEASPQAACDLLVRHANAAGGEDNISVIIIQVEAA